MNKHKCKHNFKLCETNNQFKSNKMVFTVQDGSFSYLLIWDQKALSTWVFSVVQYYRALQCFLLNASLMDMRKTIDFFFNCGYLYISIKVTISDVPWKISYGAQDFILKYLNCFYISMFDAATQVNSISPDRFQNLFE